MTIKELEATAKGRKPLTDTQARATASKPLNRAERELWLPGEWQYGFAVGYQAALFDIGKRARPKFAITVRVFKDSKSGKFKVEFKAFRAVRSSRNGVLRRPVSDTLPKRGKTSASQKVEAESSAVGSHHARRRAQGL